MTEHLSSKDQLKNKYTYRIPLRYFIDLEKINFPVKMHFKIKYHLETEMKRLSESKKVLASTAAVPAPNAKIIFTKVPFLQCEQLLLDKIFRQYLETIMFSKKILMMGVQKTPIQKKKKKKNEIKIGTETIKIYFLASNRQFDWIELSLIYDESDKHTTIYNSYNVELTAKTMKSVKLSNYTEIYSLTNEKKYDINNLTQRYLLCKQFVAWSCIGSNVAPLTDYINNQIYQELINENDYFETKRDERIYLDLRASSGYTNKTEKLERNDSKITLSILLKAATTKKLRLRVWAYSVGEYLYILSRSGLTFRHRMYTINQDAEDLLECEENNL